MPSNNFIIIINQKKNNNIKEIGNLKIMKILTDWI